MSPSAVRDCVANIFRLMRQEHERHRDVKDDLYRRLEEIRSQCSHKHKRQCMGTPYDSNYWTCDDCGKDEI